MEGGGRDSRTFNVPGRFSQAISLLNPLAYGLIFS